MCKLQTTIRRLVRHAWLDEADARRAVPPVLADTLRRQIAASERRHGGEIRICVEGSLPLSYLWRHLRQRTDIADIVRQRAIMMFAKLRVWDTEQNNGVLIYLLLAERAIEIVADRGLHPHVAPQDWQAMVQRLSGALAGGHLEQGLTGALEEVSAVLVAHCARTSTSPVNELPDEPVLR
ncbi:MAG: TPM domain-containing protein [Ottowia sp.]|nr:TPM domain-containing protein [Ottowia sp.]